MFLYIFTVAVYLLSISTLTKYYYKKTFYNFWVYILSNAMHNSGSMQFQAIIEWKRIPCSLKKKGLQFIWYKMIGPWLLWCVQLSNVLFSLNDCHNVPDPTVGLQDYHISILKGQKKSREKRNDSLLIRSLKALSSYTENQIAKNFSHFSLFVKTISQNVSDVRIWPRLDAVEIAHGWWFHPEPMPFLISV